MNQHCYRLVFNRHRHMLMAVAETTPAHGSPARGAVRTASARPLAHALRPLAACLLLAMGMLWPLQALAQIVADPSAPGSQRPTVLSTSSGAVQVNIQTPSAGGVSLNQYRQFDTGTAGTILNNSRVSVQTQSAGWIAANPWLATGSARVIVNQVNSQNPSLLRGTLEVAGQRAEVIIANPAGLQVSGATFLNASRTILTSGTPVLNGGSLEGYRVSGGQVRIDGAGLDSSSSDYTAILARSVQANAGVWAQQLQVGTGSNAYAADTTRQDALADSGTAPVFALDVAALGGMYAGKITLIGTEHGLGVRNAGKLVAGSGGLLLQADGQLLNSGTIASTDTAAALQLQATSVRNDGTLSSAQDLQLDSRGTLDNLGTLSAARQLTLVTAQVDNASSGAIDAQRLAITTAALANSGQLRQSGRQGLALQAGQLQNSGSIGALPAGTATDGSLTPPAEGGTGSVVQAVALPLPPGGQADGTTVQPAPVAVLPDGAVLVSGVLDNRGSILANGGVDLDSQGGLVNHGTLALRQLQVRGDSFDNSQGSIRAHAANIATTAINNQQGQLQVLGDATLQSQGFMNQDGKIGAGGSLQLHSGQLDNQRGSVLAEQALTVQAAQLDNRDGVLASRQGSASLQLAAVNNQRGQLLAASALQLTSFAALDNRLGSMQASSLQLQAASVDNRGGTLAADTLSSRSGALDNGGGLIQASQQLAIDTRGQALHNADSGNQRGILSGGQLQLQVGELANLAGGRIQAAGKLQLESSGVHNQQAVISGGDVVLHSGALHNQGGQIQAGGPLSIDTHGQALTNDSGASIVSTGPLTMRSAALLNGTGSTIGSQQSLQLQADSVRNAGLLAGQTALQLQAHSLDNGSGQVQAVTLGIQLANGTLDNRQGLLLGSQRLDVQAGDIDNRLTSGTAQGLQAGQLALAAASLDNTQGQLRSAGDTHIRLAAQLDNHDGTLASGGSLQLAATGVDNSRGQLQAGQDLQLVADSLAGSGTLAAGRDLTLQLQTGLTLAGSTQAGRDLRIATPGALTHAGTLRTGGQASLQAAALHNQAGAEISAQALAITVASRVDNAGLIDAGLLTISAPDAITNQPGGRLYGDRIALASASLHNQSDAGRAATIAVRQDLQLGVGQLINAENSLIYSDGSLAIGGQLDSQHQATGSAQLVHNQSATIEAQVDLAIAADTIRNERLRTSITQQNSIDDTAYMQVASWQGNGHNGHDLRSSANYRAYEILYLNPADIVSNDTFITPDGKQLGRAVVKLTPQTSSFFFARGRGWSATGERWRTSVPVETTRTIYYLWRQDAQANPDQFAGGDDPFVELTPTGGGGAPAFAYQYDGVQYSPQYGTCTSNCVQLVTPYQLDDPTRTIVHRLNHPSQEPGNEAARIAHHTAIDDVLAADAGAAAVIRSGGNMQLAPGQLLDNRYSQIAAGGSLLVDGSSEGQGSSKVVNTAATLYRLHQFSNTHITYGFGSYQGAAPDIRTELGSVAASITANQALVINGGDVGNLDQGRHAPHVQTPAAPGAGAANVRGGSDGIIRVTPPAGAMPGLVQTGSVNVTLPRSSLYHRSAASSPYLIQTDPAFTQYRQWLGSDYMLQAMAIDPATAQQRLGDGYYEQKLIRDQVAQLTGRRFLAGYSNDEAQYRALMDNGLTFASQYGLRPGIALSPEQMARLTSDIVWLVAHTITLPDGSQQTALVPQVYVKLKPGDAGADGALLAADRLQLKLGGDLTNQGQIAGRQLLAINADNLHNLGGQLSGQDIALQARTDINNLGGQIRAGSSLQLAAGRDIAVSSTTHSQQYGSGGNRLQQTTVERVAGLYVDGGTGLLLASAGRDLTLAGARLVNQADGGSTHLQAGRNVDLATVSSGESRDVRWNTTDRLHSSQQAETGTHIRTTGDLTLVAGQDLSARAANLASDKGAVTLQAGRDLSLVNGENTSSVDWQTQSSKKGTFSRKTTNESEQRQQTDIVSSSVSGHSISLQAGSNMAIQASQVVSDQATTLKAGGNITVAAAQNSSSESHSRDEKKSGLMSSGGLGVTVGKAQQGNANTVTTTQAVGSTIGSVQGDVSIQAGKDLQLKGSDVIAGQDITLAAQNVRIEHAEHTQIQQTSSYSKQSGVTVALSGGVVDAAQTAVSAAQAAGNSNNSRLAALQSVKAGLAGYQAVQTAQQGGGNGEVADPSFVGVSVSLGSQRSQSQSQTSSSNASSSELNAGGNVHITATGDGSKGADGVANTGDLAMIGSSIKAQNVTLDAARDITLQSAQNRSDTTGSHSSSGGAVGVSVGVGSGKAGISVFANANRASGKENGDTDSYTESNITAGQTLTLNSGRDTTLTGAQASGDTMAANVGRSLTLTSQQDQDNYASQQRSISAGGSVAIIGTGGGVNASLSRQRIDSQYQSVAEQSGLYAGQGGFNVQVGGHTQLDGAVIASSASPEQNQLSTATLGWQDLQNRAEYRVESQSIGASSSSSASGNLAANALGNASTLLNGGHTQGSASSTTLAAISAGSLTVRDSAAQQQDTATLRRDTSGTANGLSPIFNKQAELDRLQAIQLIGDIGQQTLQIANTHKRAELNAATERAKADPAYANSADYQQLQATWGKGGSVQQAITAVTAALQGLAGGDASAAIAGAAAPYLASQIKQLTTDPATGQVNTAANAMAHALLGATIAAAKGDNAVAGAAGAGSAPLIAATLAQNLYGSDAANLTESQKDTVAALTTLAGSLAGGLAGGNAASALAGGQGAKNEVENNSLNTRAATTLMQTLRACAGRCDVAQLSREIQQQEQYWDKVVAERCGGGGASLAVCASTLNGLQESLFFISSALGMAKTPQERALLLATYNEQVRDINTATAQFEKLGASASVIDVFMTQTALILPDLALSVGGNGRPALAVKPAAGGQSAGGASAIATSGKVDKVEALFGQTFASIPLSHTAGKQNGDLGETLALQLLNEKTTLKFQPLQNASGHGCDGCAVAIHGDTITVVVMDAKSSQMGVGGAKNTAGDPEARLWGWVNNPSIFSIPENKIMVQKIKDALSSGAFKVQGVTVKVGVPAPGTSGVATFKVESWPK